MLHSKVYSAPVDPDFGFRRIVLELSVPRLPAVGRRAISFAEHVLDGSGEPTDTVIACVRGGVIVSENLGDTWDHIAISELEDVYLCNSFTTSNGDHILQGRTAGGIDETPKRGDPAAPTALIDKDWRLTEVTSPGTFPWHGTRSIDESNGAIVFAEYTDNSAKYASDVDLSAPSPEQRQQLHASRLFRSTDGGRSWEPVLAVDWQDIRHFHTVAADRWCSDRWWASSGDTPEECRVWQSLDGGVTWDEVSAELTRDDLSPALGDGRIQRVLRYTDLIVEEKHLIWGTDDYLGAGSSREADAPFRRRGGARLFCTEKDAPWKPRSIGYVGSSVRSLIDAGPAYIVTTEAKGVYGFCPQVLLLSKSSPHLLAPLMTVDNFTAGATGFTHSRASRKAKDGVWFSYRAKTDCFPDGPYLLRWRIHFE